MFVWFEIEYHGSRSQSKSPCGVRLNLLPSVLTSTSSNRRFYEIGILANNQHRESNSWSDESRWQSDKYIHSFLESRPVIPPELPAPQPYNYWDSMQQFLYCYLPSTVTPFVWMPSLIHESNSVPHQGMKADCADQQFLGYGTMSSSNDFQQKGA